MTSSSYIQGGVAARDPLPRSAQPTNTVCKTRKKILVSSLVISCIQARVCMTVNHGLPIYTSKYINKQRVPIKIDD